MNEAQQFPLFPLSTVLFPGGPLPLRLFEARYIDMVSRCMREGQPFGVVAIREGRETGPSVIHETGTLASITDFYQGSDGLLGITAVGESRFRLIDEFVAADGLRMGRLEILEGEPSTPLPDRFEPLAEMLENILDDLGKLYEDLPRHLDDATWVGYRFCEILPLPLMQKQRCLEIEDAVGRLDIIATMLSKAPEQAQ